MAMYEAEHPEPDRKRQERVSGAPILWMTAPKLGTPPKEIRKSTLPNAPVDYDQETGKLFAVKPETPQAEPSKCCDFCGHELMPERVAPGLNSKFDADPEGEGGSDGKIWICVDECFCSYGGCRPEDWNR